MNEATLSQTFLALNINQTQLDDKNIAEVVKNVILDLSNTAQTYSRMLSSWNHAGGSTME
jgi:hypothetical protein